MECFGGKLNLPIGCVDQIEGKSFSKPTFPVPVLLPIIWTKDTKCGMSSHPLPSLSMGAPKLVGLLWIVFGFTFLLSSLLEMQIQLFIHLPTSYILAGKIAKLSVPSLSRTLLIIYCWCTR